MARLPSFARCSVCNSQFADRVDALLAARKIREGGPNNRAIGKKYGFSRDQIQRHAMHVEPERLAALSIGKEKMAQLSDLATDESKSLLEYLGILRIVLFRQVIAAAQVEDRSGLGITSGRLLETLRDVAKLTGQLREVSGITVNNTVNVFSTTDFEQLVQGLLELTRRHPGARDDIIRLVDRLDSSSTSSGPNGSPFKTESILIEGEGVEAADAA